MYKIDSPHAEEFINHDEILATLDYAQANKGNRELIRSIIEKARACKGLTHREAAVLLECEDSSLLEEIYALAREIKQRFYGNRIVMFAPLYLSNYCVNSCVYCPYHIKNKSIARKKLTQDEIRQEVIALQDKWKTIGFAPKKSNVKIFERFRAACDEFFKRKAEFFKSIKESMAGNLEKKKALCEKAEALKESTDWKATADILSKLQKEWKTIGPVPKKYSDAVWKRFIAACDYFFEQKNKNVVSQKSIEQTNLAAKKELIAKIKGMDESLGHDEAIATLKSYMAEWNTIGFVPFKEKDKIYKEYHEAVDQQFDRLKVDQNDRKMQSFRNNLNEMTSGERGKGRLFSERDKLMRMYERMKNELQTYENNIGFLSISSKGGGGLLKEMERKIEKLKEDMALTVKKIDAIDENLE